jgi:hypothetical protein
MFERADLPDGVAVVIAEPGSDAGWFYPRPEIEPPDDVAFRTTIDGRFRYMTAADLERASSELLQRAATDDPSGSNAGALADQLTAHGYWPSATRAIKRALKRLRGDSDEPPPWQTHERIDGPC